MNPSRALEALAEAIKESGQTACMTTDPDAWFPEKGMLTHESRNAIKLCQQCPVRKQCLIYGIESKTPYGIFGGLTPAERFRLKRKTPASDDEGF